MAVDAARPASGNNQNDLWKVPQRAEAGGRTSIDCPLCAQKRPFTDVAKGAVIAEIFARRTLGKLRFSAKD